MRRPIAVLRGTFVNDLFLIPLTVNGRKVRHIVVDTGASTLIFNGKVARQLRLPNLGAVGVAGVGGTANAFRSKCDVKFSSKLFRNVPCVVIQHFSKPGLLGLKFFRDHHLALALNPSTETLKIYAMKPNGKASRAT
ncbi:retropepsin-like aspartic protease [Alicyclobacillus fastidiosus]|uniref:Retropepsin-like aspartic protease n=1 Tax=Alicyclobacillus fastidiosus TaxID=392011 RepID=A0ABV5AAR9_9BACL|nr:retropepsin-like aspartic protease [Alicyclobacillus fastidiosus]WEH10854.1 retropepsin-like aspartic protease [Alicyclobacillus fastidiosus]